MDFVKKGVLQGGARGLILANISASVKQLLNISHLHH